MISENKGKSDTNTAPLKKSNRINKHHIQGLITGILIMLIIFGGILYTSPNLLTGTAFDRERTPFLLPVISYQERDQIIADSKDPLIIYYTYASCETDLMNLLLKSMNDDFIGDIRICQVDPNVDFDDLLPMMVLYIEGRLVDRLSCYTDPAYLDHFITAANNRISPPAPTPTPTPTPTPEPEPKPTIYRTFPNSTSVRGLSEANDIHSCGELILTPYDFEIVKSRWCRKDIQFLIKENTALYSLLGNTYGGDSERFYLPDLSGESPMDGIEFSILLEGNYPNMDGDRGSAIGDFKYFPISYPYYDVDDLYIGEILLAKELDSVDQNVFGQDKIVPCDGRALSVDENMPLYSLIGTKFGGNATTFNLPDLRGLSPVEGAEYYMVTFGIYPSSF